MAKYFVVGFLVISIIVLIILLLRVPKSCLLPEVVMTESGEVLMTSRAAAGGPRAAKATQQKNCNEGGTYCPDGRMCKNGFCV